MKTTLRHLLMVAVLCCLAEIAIAQTAGTLTFTYTQNTPTSPSVTGGGNVYAVWIETAAGAFVKTKCRYVSTSTDDHLPSWAAKCGCSSVTAVAAPSTTGCNTTDALTGTTRKANTVPTAFGAKTVTWDGKNVVGTTNGTTVADGVYKIWVESSWNDGPNNIHNELIGFTFTKGPTEQTLTPTGDTNITGVTLHWLPSALSVEDTAVSPVVTIYPVPSSGIFNIDLKNQVDTIRVFDLLGKTLYEQQLNPNDFNESVQLDLSHLAEGNYVISLQNAYGVSNYEVILNR